MIVTASAKDILAHYDKHGELPPVLLLMSMLLLREYADQWDQLMKAADLNGMRLAGGTVTTQTQDLIKRLRSSREEQVSHKDKAVVQSHPKPSTTCGKQ